VAPSSDVAARQQLEEAVAAAVAQLEIPSTYRDRVNALAYYWFNDDVSGARVRSRSNGKWRDIAPGDLPAPVVTQLSQLLAYAASF